MRFVHDYLSPIPTERDVLRDRINEAVRGSHSSEVKAWTCDYDVDSWKVHPLVDDTGWKEVTYEIISGEVTEHLGEAVARELNLDVASEYWDDPFDALQEISPYRTLIAVARGISQRDGTLWIPLGVFRVWNVSTAGSAENAIQISVRGYSMEVVVRDARFWITPVAGTGTGQIGATSIQGVIQKLLDAAFPKTVPGNFVPFDVVSDGLGIAPEDYLFPTKTILTDDRDRLDLILRLQEDRNVWGRFDRGNHYRIDTMPSVLDDPVPWIVDTGDNGVLVSYSKEYTRNQVYNAVLCFGEYGGPANTDPKFQASWFATDGPGLPTWNPDSPTAWGGPYGYVPRFQRIGFLPNNATRANEIVRETAESILARAMDFKAGISFESVPNPLLEAGDVVEIHYPVGMRVGVVVPRVERHLITSLTVGLGADTQLSADTMVSSQPESGSA
jgi:hypothetical protein